MSRNIPICPICKNDLYYTVKVKQWHSVQNYDPKTGSIDLIEVESSEDCSRYKFECDEHGEVGSSHMKFRTEE